MRIIVIIILSIIVISIVNKLRLKFTGNKMVNQQQDEINRQMQEQFDREFIDFSNKSVTSFDDGGFVQGPGFNLSDTMMSNMNNGF